MTQALKEYIEHYIDLIENNDYLPLYKALMSDFRGELTEVLFKAGIHPEKYLDVIPPSFAANTTMVDNVKLCDKCMIISSSAFRGSAIKNIELNNHLHQIDYEAFAFCHNLKNITIPDSVRVIAEGAFLDCKHLQQVQLSNKLECIDRYVFCQCYSLSSSLIPASVVKIKNDAFLKCHLLQTLNYEGTIDMWNAIEKNTSWNRDKDIVNVSCADGVIDIL